VSVRSTIEYYEGKGEKEREDLERERRGGEGGKIRIRDRKTPFSSKGIYSVSVEEKKGGKEGRK